MLDEKIIYEILNRVEKERQMKERDAILQLTRFRIDKKAAKDILKECEKNGKIERRMGRIFIVDDLKF